MRPKAYSYIRFSSVEQAKGHSKKRQLERAREYAEKHSLNLVTEQEYAFFDAGKSAYKAKHLTDDGELKRFLRLVEDGSIPKGSYLLVENLDRLSREKVSVAVPRFMDLLASGIKVVTLTDERVYDENFSEMDLIISIVQMSRAHEESASKGYRVSKAWQNKQVEARTHKKPLGKACPAWLMVEDDSYKVIEKRADIIRQIFDMTCQGYGRQKIIRHLNENGIPPFGYGDDEGPRSNRNKTKAWGTSTIAKLLKNKALIGEYQPYRSTDSGRVPIGEPIKEYYPSIISEELFYRVQRIVSERQLTRTTKQSSQFNFWQKVSFCASCKSPMHLVNKGKPPKGYTYLTCSKARKGACDGKFFRIDMLEMFIPRILFMLDSLPLLQGNESKIQNEIEALEGKKKILIDQIEKYSELLALHPSEATAKVLAEREHEVRSIQNRIEEKSEMLNHSFVTDWEAFTSAIDLESYEGRLQANSLIKRLGIVFTFASQRGDPEFDYPLDVILHVTRNEQIDDNDAGFWLLHSKYQDFPEYQMLGEEYIERAKHYGFFESIFDRLGRNLDQKNEER